VKNSLKFISIGLVMVVLLMSQWAIDRPAEAAAVAEDAVEWRNSSDAAVSYYSTGGATSTATFWLKDGALETTPAASTTWSSISTSIADAATLTLGTGAISGTGAASTTTLDVAGGFTPGTSALSAAPSLTVNSNVVTIDQYNLTAGTFSLGDASGTTGSVVADFNYHKIDSYDGATAGQKIAKVTSTSDSTGTWVSISEVSASGGSTASYTADFYKGSVILSRNAGDAEVAGSVFVADGDTITVSYYGCGTSCTDGTDSTTLIASDTAIIDDTDPAITITSADATDDSLLNDTTPTLSFTVTDGASGFTSTSPTTHLTVLVNGCRVNAAELSWGTLAADSLKATIALAFGTTWATAPNATCDGSTRASGGFGIDTTSATTTPTSTSHGKVFSYSITATDLAGNDVTLDGTSANITVDTQVPDMGDAVAGKGWTTKEVDQKNGLSVTFDESLDAASVTTDDFTVDGTAPTSIVMGGTGVTTNKVVYLVMESDLAPNATPDVRLVGSVTDLAGNELKDSSSNTNCTTAPCGYADRDSEAADEVNPTISNVVVDSNLLAKSGTATLTFDSDEAMKDNGATIAAGCTCVLVSGGGAAGNPTATKLAVTMPTSVTSGTAAFKQTAYSTTGIYGLVIQAVDVKDNEGNLGGVEVANENVSSQFTVSSTGTSTYTAIKLSKWPLADHDADGSLSDSITASINGGSAVAVTINASNGVNWGTAETVNIAITGAAAAITSSDTVKLTYYYADAAHTVEVDVTGPTVASKSPSDGSSTENTTPFVSVTWSDDEYAGDTNTTVTISKAEHTDPDGTTTDISADLSTTDNKSFFFRPSGLAVGEHTFKFSATDAAGNETADQSWKFSVTAKAQTSVALLPGWNLVSLPGTPADTAINSVITSTQVDTVVTYDPSVPGGWLTAVRADGVLSGTLATIDAQRGYWVHTANDDPIKVDIPGYTAGSQQLPPAIALVKGWNLVPAVTISGAASMDADLYFTGLSWTRGYGFNTSSDSFVSFISDTTDDAEGNIAVGKGYWIFLTKAGDLVP